MSTTNRAASAPLQYMLGVQATVAPAGHRAEALPTATSRLLQSSSAQPVEIGRHALLASWSQQLSLSLPGPEDTLGLLLQAAFSYPHPSILLW